MTVDEILNGGGGIEEIISALKNKTLTIPSWRGPHGLAAEYDPRQHPVMDKQRYPDIVNNDGVTRVTRIACDLQRLAVKRMTELVCGVPVKRVYKAANDRQSEVAAYLEAIFDRNRVDSVNIERCNMLFAGCEVVTLWYAVEQPNNDYGFASRLKMRCRNFSPMLGDNLYPLFDEYGDMIALSVGYERKVNGQQVQYFDCYTANKHLKWSNAGGAWATVEDELTTVGKIPAVYVWRPAPIWEQSSPLVYEIEWSLSRNGNYLRENSKPLFVVFADQNITYDQEGSPDREYKGVMQFPAAGKAEYITWQQAVDNLKFYVNELRSLFFTQLQLPDWSYEKMSSIALSGESRKQLFIDAQMKVKDESGRLLEFFDREVNVVKAFLKIALGDSYAADIDALKVETVITPFTITDESDTVNRLVAATGGKAIMSQREAIQELGRSDDPDQTIKEIAEENRIDAMELAE
jgi:hypothetical protein